ncbi:MAG: hypothetical protein C0508_05430 [Cyanobacteria bacterium PR.023]|nr:hypothetical protein [Cyanobacteria bacterium PR.023]
MVYKPFHKNSSAKTALSHQPESQSGLECQPQTEPETQWQQYFQRAARASCNSHCSPPAVLPL